MKSGNQSAERALQDLGAAAAADVTALLSAELDRCREAVRKSLEQAIGGNAEVTQKGITGFVDRFVAAAAAASDAAAQRTRAEIQVEVDRIQAALANVRSELEKTRKQVETTQAAIQTEQAARTKAETALKEAEQTRQKMAATYEAEAQTLRGKVESRAAEIANLLKQFEAEKAERARLVSAIQQVVNPGASIAAAAPPPSVTTKERASVPVEPVALPELSEEEPEGDPQLLVYVQHLFTTMEAMYSGDVAKGRRPDELVSCLTQYLQSARTVFQNHVGAAENGELKFFDRHLSELIGEETPFARHLGMAAYECSKTERTGSAV